MGDRVSISFVTRNERGRVDDESVAVFDHWGGKEFPKRASDFIKSKLPKTFSPSDAIAPFMFSIGKDAEDLYFGKDETEGDNSDNGHYRIDCDTGAINKVQVRDTPKKPMPSEVAKTAVRTALVKCETVCNELTKALAELETFGED